MDQQSRTEHESIHVDKTLIPTSKVKLLVCLFVFFLFGTSPVRLVHGPPPYFFAIQKGRKGHVPFHYPETGKFKKWRLVVTRHDAVKKKKGAREAEKEELRPRRFEYLH